MQFTSPHPVLSLPPSSLTLPQFLLDVPDANRAALPLFLPPAADSIFASTRPNLQPLSIDDTRARAIAVAQGLLAGKLGGAPFKKGDVIAVASANQHDYVANVLGILLVGGVAALVNPAYKPREVVHALRVTGARAILASDAPDVTKPLTDAEAQISPYQTAQEANQILRQNGELDANLPIFLFEEGRSNSWSQIYEGQSASEDELYSLNRASGTDTAVCCFSSGTSGLPKAVALSHGNLIANVIQSARSLADRFNIPIKSGEEFSKNGAQGWYDGTDVVRARNLKSSNADVPYISDEVHVDILPQFHCYGFMINLIAMHTVTPRVVLPRFHLPTFLKTIQDARVTSSFVVPPVILALGKHPLIDQYDLSSLRVLGSGADNLKNEIAKLVHDRLGVTTCDGYGMTEMSPIVSAQLAVDVVSTRGSVGKLCPNTNALVLDHEGKEMGPGESGEILFQGPQMMIGYWNNEEATKAAFYIRPSDGSKWYRTGDVGSLDSNGAIYVSHRVKDVLKVKGFQVSPKELEELLAEDPLVADVAVVGFSDEKQTKQIPWAFAVASPCDTEQTLELVATAILKRANEQLAAYKRIQGLTWLDALPKSASGKVLKRELVTMRPPTMVLSN